MGAVFGLVALGLMAWQTPRMTGWLDQSVFGILAITTVVACAATISARNPLYSALWFGLALLGTAGLFLITGAQFLSVATITVYAGAILVTFLFVIMLAQPEGQAPYDRLSWEAPISAAAGAILVGLLTSAVGHALAGGEGETPVARAASDTAAAASSTEEGVLAKEHVAAFGRELVGKHLIAMQAAGALMLAALVGAVAIVTHGRNSAPRAEPDAQPHRHGQSRSSK
jgi:NADH-quinone oxidoreductase subunit J